MRKLCRCWLGAGREVPQEVTPPGKPQRAHRGAWPARGLPGDGRAGRVLQGRPPVPTLSL